MVEEHGSDIEDLCLGNHKQVFPSFESPSMLRKVKMQEAFNSLQKLDLSSMKEEMDAAVRRMERRHELAAGM